MTLRPEISSSQDRRGARKCDTGFSLLEMLIALAIMSLTSLALFQSVGTMLSVSDRAVLASERTLENVMTRRNLGRLIDGLVPHWDEAPEVAFKGNAREFSGLSADAMGAEYAQLTSFKMSLVDGVRSGSSLIYEANGHQWVIFESLPAGIRVEYLGSDQIWRGSWPPERPRQVALAEGTVIERPWKLPAAIRFSVGADRHYMTSYVGRQQDLPGRLDVAREQ